ncbi:hypothetical protein HAX54_024976, partial [Datura stramonium]|nr:hypothetical protein [Datura stramonium]
MLEEEEGEDQLIVHSNKEKQGGKLVEDLQLLKHIGGMEEEVAKKIHNSTLPMEDMIEKSTATQNPEEKGTSSKQRMQVQQSGDDEEIVTQLKKMIAEADKDFQGQTNI